MWTNFTLMYRQNIFLWGRSIMAIKSSITWGMLQPAWFINWTELTTVIYNVKHTMHSGKETEEAKLFVSEMWNLLNHCRLQSLETFKHEPVTSGKKHKPLMSVNLILCLTVGKSTWNTGGRKNFLVQFSIFDSIFPRSYIRAEISCYLIAT